MRLLHIGDDHDSRGALEWELQSAGGRDRAFHGRQHLPLWDAPAYCGCHTEGGTGAIAIF